MSRKVNDAVRTVRGVSNSVVNVRTNASSPTRSITTSKDSSCRRDRMAGSSASSADQRPGAFAPREVWALQQLE